jgi:N-methylhydantoinase B
MVEVHPLGDQLRVLDGAGRRFVGCRCGYVLAPAEQPWRPAAGLDVSTDIAVVSSASRFTDELELRRYACPGCGVLLATDVVRRGAEHRHDIEFLTGKQETNG